MFGILLLIFNIPNFNWLQNNRFKFYIYEYIVMFVDNRGYQDYIIDIDYFKKMQLYYFWNKAYVWGDAYIKKRLKNHANS